MHSFWMLDDHYSVAVTFTKFQFHLLYMHVLFQSVHSCESLRAKMLVENEKWYNQGKWKQLFFTYEVLCCFTCY